MTYNIAAVYQKETDEVYVETFIENDQGLAVVADSVVISLQHETRDLTGLVRYLTVDSMEVERDFVSPNKHFILRFKNPMQKLNLWVEVSFKQGVDITTKKAFVGVPDTPQVVMDLPNNKGFMVEIEDDYYSPTNGGNDIILPENEIVLSPDISSAHREYNFNGTTDDFSGIMYSGGGNRFLVDQATNKFIFQEADVAPWDLKTFCFLEDAARNQLDVTFAGWEIGPTSALVESSTGIDVKLSEELKVWTLRCRQSRPEYGNRDIILKTKDKTPVLPGVTYCFSNYIQILPKNKVTKADSLKLVINWFDAQDLTIKRDVKYLSGKDFKGLNLSYAAFLSPLNASSANVEVMVGSVDSGDDLEIKLFAPQLEIGALPTSRVLTDRSADSITIEDLNIEHFRLRTVFVPGFAHTDKAWTLVNGVLKVRFAPGTMNICLGDPGDEYYASLDVPFTYEAFSELDLTFEVKSGDHIKFYDKGVFVTQTPLTEFEFGFGVLEIKGSGIELNQLLTFTRG